jgi:hypothetical protein
MTKFVWKRRRRRRAIRAENRAYRSLSGIVWLSIGLSGDVSFRSRFLPLYAPSWALCVLSTLKRLTGASLPYSLSWTPSRFAAPRYQPWHGRNVCWGSSLCSPTTTVILISSRLWYCLTILFVLLTRIKVLLGKFWNWCRSCANFLPLTHKWNLPKNFTSNRGLRESYSVLPGEGSQKLPF